MRNVTVAAVQMQCSHILAENLATAERLVDRLLVRERRLFSCLNSLSVLIFVKNANMTIIATLNL